MGVEKMRLLQLLLLVGGVSAHVRLTFPPARWPGLDFLDNTRTPEHCGLPKPALNGQSLNSSSVKGGAKRGIEGVVVVEWWWLSSGWVVGLGWPWALWRKG